MCFRSELFRKSPTNETPEYIPNHNPPHTSVWFLESDDSAQFDAKLNFFQNLSPRELSGKFPSTFAHVPFSMGPVFLSTALELIPFSHSSICVRANPRPFLKDLSGFLGENSVIQKISGRIQSHSHVWKRFPRLVMFWCEGCTFMNV